MPLVPVPPTPHHLLPEPVGLDLATGFLCMGWGRKQTFLVLGIITEMQILLLLDEEVGNRKVRTILKATVQLREQNTPPKELKN